MLLLTASAAHRMEAGAGVSAPCSTCRSGLCTVYNGHQSIACVQPGMVSFVTVHTYCVVLKQNGGVCILLTCRLCVSGHYVHGLDMHTYSACEKMCNMCHMSEVQECRTSLLVVLGIAMCWTS